MRGNSVNYSITSIGGQADKLRERAFFEAYALQNAKLFFRPDFVNFSKGYDDDASLFHLIRLFEEEQKEQNPKPAE